ncbi:hypothetical protein [Microbispora sp. NPDC049125]|uniref:hypothetical protein n=1 Tax=Microbispora sp. NPDC049125 TaxID=3154929 RepID=UPI0034671723
MRHTTPSMKGRLGGLTLAALTAAGAATAVPSPAQAGTQAGVQAGVQARAGAGTQAHARAHGSIRYVSVKGCEDKESGSIPCGSWRLDLHDGTHVTLKDAQVRAHDAKGKTVRAVAAPITVSGNGGAVAYFRRSDGRIVVRETHGPVHVMPKNALPKGVGTDEADLRLSQDGRHLAVEYTGDDADWRARVFDVSNPRENGDIPAADEIEGFSGDGSALLVTKLAGDNTTELIAYDLRGEEIARVVPPQVVANNLPRALSSDDRTVAFVTGSARKPVLKLYDMVTDQVVGSVRFKLPGGTLPDMVDWTGDHQVTLHIMATGGSGDHVTVLEVDTETGGVKVRDSYKVRAGTFTYGACGG